MGVSWNMPYATRMVAEEISGRGVENLSRFARDFPVLGSFQIPYKMSLSVGNSFSLKHGREEMIESSMTK